MSSKFTSENLFSLLQENNVKLSICYSLKKLYELEHETPLDELIFDSYSYRLLEEWISSHLNMCYGDVMVHVAKRFNIDFSQHENAHMREYLLMACGLEELDKLGHVVGISVTADACFMINHECLDSDDRLPVTELEKRELSTLKARVSKRLVNHAQTESDIDPVHILIDAIDSLKEDEKYRLIKADPTLKIKKKGVTYYADSIFWSNVFHELLPLMDNTSIECHGA